MEEIKTRKCFRLSDEAIEAMTAITTQRQMTMTEAVQQALINYHRRQWYHVRTMRTTIYDKNIAQQNKIENISNKRLQNSIDLQEK